MTNTGSIETVKSTPSVAATPSLVSAVVRSPIKYASKAIDWIAVPTNGLNVLKAYNLLTAAFVTKGYYKTPTEGEATPNFSEYWFDVAVHTAHVAASTKNTTEQKSIQAGLVAANVVRLAWIAESVVRHTNTVPTKIDYVDVVNHVVNLAALAFLFAQRKSSSTSPNATPAATPAAVPTKS